MPLLYRNANSIFNRPTSTNSFTNCPSLKARFFRPLIDCFSKHVFIGSFVSGLFFNCRPSTIFRRIGTIVINTVNGMLCRWFQSHISKEIFKLKPSIANCNSSSSIEVIIGGVWIDAALPHSAPCPPFRSFTFSMSGHGMEQ